MRAKRWTSQWPAALALSCGLGLAGCGQARTTGGAATPSAVASSRLGGDGDEESARAIAKEQRKADVDGDADNEGNSRYDWDDSNVFDYGHPASPPDISSVDGLVARYYAAAVAGDGATACGLVSAGVLKTVRHDFGERSGPLGLGKGPCRTTMSKLFRRLHVDVSADGHPPAVGLVRVQGSRAYVLLTSEGTHADRYTVVTRQRGAWKVDSLFDMDLP